MQIEHRVISPDEPYFIAEAGVNHNGDLEMAEKLIDAAADAGADAVKFQTFSADRLVTEDTEKADYQEETSGEGSQYEMLRNYELDRAAHERLQNHCQTRDITFLSTPFDVQSADLLADLGVPAVKLGSGEFDNHPLLEHVAELGLPMIVSTGMGTMDEVREARDVIRSVDPKIDLAFLHCTSEYPCDIEDMNLRAMEQMDEAFTEPVGYSDHTTYPETPSFAVSGGAQILEKHFTLDRTLPGPDHKASLEPDKLERAVTLSRLAARARGNAEKQPTAGERRNKSTTRKSLHAAVDLSAGEVLSSNDINILRPTDGLSPKHYDTVIGAVLETDLGAGDPITTANVDVTLESERDV
ncbi:MULTISPECIES: N-acetylneuraminate synthase [Halomicrobium]|uniref:N-acylneuraminate-9-phosphate synthase n=2 Tax=Halomicrobium mukohataei TaxID=57705 RepID=C7P3A3_HALMD|nr:MULTISPECIES: N-acetylneuraminate synthase [Halomicrobium]ACV47575.1 N-acylneuraminate-9-phosphate synthase [Halomicrobium mukohataei DSM 12286]QCD66038.1 N-acetylneuraminate synthase [Halomicrobium mukohataei]QFR20843.1 N-acetylneuraminate synthase [Halomicrobium sp. ZPS1]